MRFDVGCLFNPCRIRSGFCRFRRPLLLLLSGVLQQELSQVDSDEVCVHIRLDPKRLFSPAPHVVATEPAVRPEA